MTRRNRIETLERRQMYAAHPFMDYTDDDAVSVAAGDVNGDGAADIALIQRGPHSVMSPRDVASGQAVGLVGDFNNDGRDDVAEFASSFAGVGTAVPSEQFSLNFTKIEFMATGANLGWNASQAVSFESHTLPHVDGLMGLLLPYMEQDNVYKLAGNGGSPFVAALYNDLLGLHVDTSPIDVEIRGIDVWEHAYLQGGPQTNGIIAVLIGVIQPETDGDSNTAALERGPATNGIIAILIGLMQDVTDGTSNTMMLTVDPSDASGNTLLRVDTSNMRGLAASLIASDEFFARFADTTLDDEAATAITGGGLNKPTQVTHDREFENWANVRGFDRGYLPPGVNSILYEENEFSFGRMIKNR